MSQINAFPLSGSSSYKQTYEEDGEIFHHLSGVLRETFSDLSSNGCLRLLIDSKLVVPTKIASAGAEFDVYVQPKGKIIYPAEWTFETLGKCGEKILRIQEILEDCGFGLLDCHPYNFVLFEGEMVFVDIGSFIKKTQIAPELFPELEFLATYVVPALTYLRKFRGSARLMLGMERYTVLSHQEYFDCFGSFFWKLPILSRHFKNRLLNAYYLRSDDEIFKKVLSHSLLTNSLQYSLFRKQMTFFWKIRKTRYLKILSSLKKFRTSSGLWSNYEETLSADAVDRFNKIVELIKEFSPSTVLDIGGNSGYLYSEIINRKELSPVEYTVLDFDESSLNTGIHRFRSIGLFPTFVYFNFAEPWVSANTIPYFKRFKSDVVVSLAFTHHMMVSERMLPERIFERYFSMCTKALVVEYMPLGLWNGGPETVMEDYVTFEQFEKAMEKYFTISHVENLEMNRIVLVGIPK